MSVAGADLCQEPEWQLPLSNSGTRPRRVGVRLELQQLHPLLQCGAATSSLTPPSESKRSVRVCACACVAYGV